MTVEGRLQVSEKQAAEEPGQHPDREEEARPTRNPALAIEREPTAGHDAVKVGMIEQGLAPGMQHGQKADLSPQMFRIRRDRSEGLGRGSKENRVHHGLVL